MVDMCKLCMYLSAKVTVVCHDSSFLTPSYYIQQLFSENYGPLLVETNIATSDGSPVNISASTTCSDTKCSAVNTKVLLRLLTAVQLTSDVILTANLQ